MNDRVIQDITMDSRQVKPGDLFIAVPGLTVDGRTYIEQALKNGAAAILCEANAYDFPSSKASNPAVIPIPHLKSIIGHIAGRFFDDPSQHLPVIGITGTSGKTSTAHFIAQFFASCHKRCAMMGTLGVGFLGELQETGCTTLDAIATQRALATLKDAHADVVAMEVTSHALAQNRVAGVQFQTAIFTNLSRDHLDYHQSMAHYWQEKQKLFLEFAPKFSIINMDDEYGQALLNEKQLYADGTRVIAYTAYSDRAEIPTSVPESAFLKEGMELITTHNLILDAAGIRATIRTPWGAGQLTCPLFGRFNLSNVLAAVATLCLQGIPLADILAATPVLTTVPGRMMRFGGMGTKPLVIVDYAHKPNALAQVLEVLRKHCKGKIWCVFGCGGDRDKGKRPLMAAHVENLSDHFIITQDNPRTEDPNAIVQDILSGLHSPEKAVIESDRKKAIACAIQAANSEDVVLIAGKGHEDYQIIGTQKFELSDIQEVQLALEKRTT